jgi:hypothetical protein
MSHYQISQQTAPKPNNDVYEGGLVRPNEDAIRTRAISDYGQLAALADGAGGEGLFAAEWAKALLQRLPQQPFTSLETLNQWIGQWWKIGFYDEMEAKAKQATGAHASFALKKFYDEGSLATLLAAWLPQNTQKPIVWRAYGDSMLFHYQPQLGKLSLLLPWQQTPDGLEGWPRLLNWATDTVHEDQWGTGELHLQASEYLLMASDGIGMAIWAKYLATNSILDAHQEGGKLHALMQKAEASIPFNDWMQSLLLATSDLESFQQWGEQAYLDGQMPRDDFSLIAIRNPKEINETLSSQDTI